MMLLSACAQLGVTDVRITCTWIPMLGSRLHKLGDALDVTVIDNAHDRLRAFSYTGAHVRDNSLARDFNAHLHGHRYGDGANLLYVGDAHNERSGSDRSHGDHLHITCNSRATLEARDLAGYRGPADPADSPAGQDDGAMPGWLPPAWQAPQIPGLQGRF